MLLRLAALYFAVLLTGSSGVRAQHGVFDSLMLTPSQLRIGLTGYLQVGLSQSTAIREELRVSSLEVLVRPLPYLSARYLSVR